MGDEVRIVDRVMEAQHDLDAADSLIREYLPFIKSETAKAIGRIPIEGKDDELSIALMAFHEAIEGYDHGKGAFLSFASLVIKRRIIDFLRHENKFKNSVSWEETMDNEEDGGMRQSAGSETVVDRESLKWEITQLVNELVPFGITLSDVAANCPKQDKSVNSCRQVITYLINEPDQMESLLETGKLPVTDIMKETSVKKKTLERHRKYLVAIAVIYYRRYDGMINHLTEVFKTQKGGN